MRVSRRSFVGSALAGSTALLTARGLEAATWDPSGSLPSMFDRNGVIALNSNENPYGPARAAIDAFAKAYDVANRYPAKTEDALREAIAARHGVKPENVLVGCGSGETLKMATEAYTSDSRHLVTASPTFEQPATAMQRLGRPIKASNVDSGLGLDLNAMENDSANAGLVFLCNPNNPTGTVHSLRDVLSFIERVNRKSPGTMILVDEAYFEYVDHPDYGTAIPAALANKSILVARTFSKVFGLAGMRVGYGIAHADVVAKLAPWRVQNGISQLSIAAAVASANLTEHVKTQQKLNNEARAYARKAMNDAGFKTLPSHTNFIMSDIKRDPKAFQDLMLTKGVAVGRPFPPLKTHARISIGTVDEMHKAMPIILNALKSA